MDAKAPLPPHGVVIALGGEYARRGFCYLPRQDGKIDGMVASYGFYVSEDGVNWGRAVATGTLSNDPAEKEVVFPSKTGSFVRFMAHAEVDSRTWPRVAEISILRIR
jgi:hypothetical protein